MAGVRQSTVGSTTTTSSTLLVRTQLRHHWYTKRTKIGTRGYESFKGQTYILKSRLSNAHTVSDEWDFEQNPVHINPTLIAASCMTPYWWKCGGCGHGYEASPESRVIRGKGCPQCRGAGANSSEVAAVDEEHPQAVGRKVKIDGKGALIDDAAAGDTTRKKVTLLAGEANPKLRAAGWNLNP